MGKLCVVNIFRKTFVEYELTASAELTAKSPLNVPSTCNAVCRVMAQCLVEKFHNSTQETMTYQNKRPFRFRLAFKNRDQLHIMNQYVLQKNESDFPGRSHWTRLPGGSRDLRVSCRRRMLASAVVCARWKTGEGWGLLFCGCQHWCVDGDGVLQLFLGQGIKALHHTVCCQTGFWVVVPAFSYCCTQKLHPLRDNNRNVCNALFENVM